MTRGRRPIDTVTTSLIGSGVATIVVGRCCGRLNEARLVARLECAQPVGYLDGGVGVLRERSDSS